MQKIPFLYQPYNPEDQGHVIEKSENGIKRRYLKGIASGVEVDGHGEKITDKAIASFHNQANTGDVLLFPDVHGVRGTDDIGILTKSEILPNNDWMIEARLYDQADAVGPLTLERIDKLWKQLKGLPPYKYPKQKGFSIEGYIPDNGIITMDSGGRRVIDDVELDGVVVVPRPAYKSASIQQAIYKALNELPAEKVEKAIKTGLQKRIDSSEMKNNYFRKRYQIQDFLEEEIEFIMINEQIVEKREAISKLLDEYKISMIDLIFQSEDIFEQRSVTITTASDERPDEQVMDLYTAKSAVPVRKLAVLKMLLSDVDKAIQKLSQ